MNDLKSICERFNVVGKLEGYSYLATGNINTSYIVTFNGGDKRRQYIIQKINKYVFERPDKVMENIVRVTNFVYGKIKQRQASAKRYVLHYIPTLDENCFYKDDNGDFWRCYRFIEDSLSFDNLSDLYPVEQAGEAFGTFQKDLSDFNATTLYEAIPHFHNTKKRIEQLKQVAEKDEFNRLKNVKAEYEYILQREKECCVLCDYVDQGLIPLRVTHNDTKCNNVLFDKNTLQALAVIDLDTVMPGALGNDFGDGARSISSMSDEDEKNLALVGFDMDRFESFTKGFIGNIGNNLNENELKTMAQSVYILTMELAVRFMTDYLTGDKYFKINYPKHNYDRTRCQIALAKDIYGKLDKMQEIVEKYYKA